MLLTLFFKTTHRQRRGPVETALPCLTCGEKEVREGVLSGAAVGGAQGCWLPMAGRPGGVYTEQKRAHTGFLSPGSHSIQH